MYKKILLLIGNFLFFITYSMDNQKPSDFYRQWKEKGERFEWLNNALLKAVQDNANFARAVRKTSGIPEREANIQPRRSGRIAKKRKPIIKNNDLD